MEENIILVFSYIVPLMPIHINTLFQSYLLPSQLVQPALSCALQQPDIKHISECWEDLLVKSVSELHGGDVPYVHAH